MGETVHKILVVDDDIDILRIFSAILRDENYQAFTAESGEKALEIVKKQNPNLVFLDIKLQGMDGIQCLKKMKEIDSHLTVVMITAYETVKSAVEAMKLGAYDYLSKPLDKIKIKILIKNALTQRKLLNEVLSLRNRLKEKQRLDKIVAFSSQMRKIFDLSRKIAQHDVTVLLRGESGTGKELIARTIHFNSTRKEGPFVPIDCAILPETLIESELFGYERGAFTGAEKQKIGKFELGVGGTIFLDEIGNLNSNLQTKLLRVIQEREIERLGGKKPVEIDIRIIAATNANLEELMKKGKFREDLYYRLNEFSITLPPLRKRKEDLDLLSKYFLEHCNKQINKQIKGFAPRVTDFFQKYTWPGNVRELRNTIQSAIILCDDEIIKFKHLPDELQSHENQSSKDKSESIANLDYLPETDQKEESFPTIKEVSKKASQKVEKEYLLQVLERVRWNKTKAARILGIDYKTLYNKLKKYEIV